MAEYKIEYTDTNDRLVKIEEQKSLGREILHDDFTDTGGVLTFMDPIPPTAEEIAERAEQRAMARAEELVDAIGSLPQAKTFLKRLVRRLIKNGSLP